MRSGQFLLASASFCLALGFAVARVGLFTHAASVRLTAAPWVMIDFYNTAYYPVRAFLGGHSPYDVNYPPYAPTHLLLHLPFALLPPGPAGIAYFAFNVLLTVALANVVLRLVRVQPEPS